MEPFFLGTQPDGGYWMTVTRLSEHDHTGGVLGKPITAATIPDGSITTSKLDPSVLAPYALTDGSKPFSGQVTMQADAVIRDELLFGEQGTGLAPDVHLRRTSAVSLRLDTNLGVGVAPEAGWAASGYNAVRIGAGAALWGPGSGSLNAYWTSNVLFDGTSRRSLAAGPLSEISQEGGVLNLKTNTGDATGSQVVAPATRMSIAKNGTVALTPDAGLVALTAQGGLAVTPAAAQAALAAAGPMVLASTVSQIYPPTDGAYYLGLSSNRFFQVYASGGLVTSSQAEAKTDITPLDPAAALAAVLATDPVTFTYTAPAPTAEQYELPDDPEQAEQVLHQRLVNAPLMEAARSQAGFVLHDETGGYHTDPLFETGFGQSNAANSVGVLIGAVHALESRLAALEGA